MKWRQELSGRDASAGSDPASRPESAVPFHRPPTGTVSGLPRPGEDWGDWEDRPDQGRTGATGGTAETRGGLGRLGGLSRVNIIQTLRLNCR